MKKCRKVISLFLVGVFTVLACVCPTNTSVYATKSIADLKSELKLSQEKYQDMIKDKNQKQSEFKGALEKKNELDLQVSSIQNDIDTIDDVINDKNSEIISKEKEIEDLTDKINKNNDQLKERIKVMYENGNVSYLEMILQAKGLSDLFTRISVVNDIMTHDKNLIEEFVTQKETVEKAKQTVESEKFEQQQAKTMIVEKKKDLIAKQKEKDVFIAQLKSNIGEAEKLEQEGKKYEEQVKRELADALAQQEKARKLAEIAKQKASGFSNSSSDNSTTPAKVSQGDFCWPSAASQRITSPFGNRIHPITHVPTFHAGIDIGTPMGSNILAAADGTVLTAGWNAGGYGYYITINHGNGIVTLYAHNSKLLVSAGDRVTKGQVIAKAGSTGNSTGPHLHFEVMVNGSVVNPLKYV